MKTEKEIVDRNILMDLLKEYGVNGMILSEMKGEKRRSEWDLFRMELAEKLLKRVSLKTQGEIDAEEETHMSTEKEEPTPTEMVDALRSKGWTVEYDYNYEVKFLSPDCSKQYFPLEKAYRSAFPRKKKVTVDVWRRNSGSHDIVEDKGQLWANEWTKGTATFEVPEEE
jgi:hypothetical protein